MDRLSSPLLALFAHLSAGAAPTLAQPQWQRHFDNQGVRGTFVLFQPIQERYLAFNEARGRVRYLPASTFKIANALAGIDTGAIADEREVFRWDRKPKLRPSWERDHTLDSGMRESAVWMFQEVARRIGKVRMREWLERLEYGNADIAGGVDLFWLQGALRVSAYEQVQFLHRLAEGRLPATQRAQRMVRSALEIERTRDYTLHAKAGTTSHAKEPVAWWVGWIERKGRPTAYFALNYTPCPQTRFDARFSIGRAILAEAGVLPQPAASNCGNMRMSSKTLAPKLGERGAIGVRATGVAEDAHSRGHRRAYAGGHVLHLEDDQADQAIIFS